MTDSTTLVPKTPAKTYHNRFPGSTFIDSKNKVHSFLGGELTTSDSQLIQELDAVSDKGGSPIFTKELILTYEDRQPVNEIQARAAATIEALKAAQKAQAGG